MTQAIIRIQQEIERRDIKKSRIIRVAGISHSTFYKGMNGTRRLTPTIQAKIESVLNIKSISH